MGKLRKVTVSTIYIAEVLFIIGSMTACTGKNNSTMPRQQTDVSNEARQSIEQPNETQQGIDQSNVLQQETGQTNETKPTAAHPDAVQQNTTEHNGHTGTSDSYIGTDSAESIALNHAGFSETEVSRLESEFDIDDGLAVYEVEFAKDGREYEYTINAIDGSIIEYDVD